MRRSRRTIGLVGLLIVMAGARPGTAQTDGGARSEPTAAAEQVTLAYDGAEWAIDPAKGPVQAVVTRRTVEAGGVTVEGIVFLEDAGGWRVAGVFRDDSPSQALRETVVDGELTLAPAGR